VFNPDREALKGKMMSSHDPRAVGEKHLVIIVDDDNAVRDSLKFSLEIEGFEVRAYAGPNELLNDGSAPPAICLITNYHMPAMDGLELMSRLRARGLTIPAFLITGHLTDNMRRRAATIGVSVLEKPFLGKRLIEGIRQAAADGQ
jgi:two-component system, LuxR family, response regulator FixJ